MADACRPRALSAKLARPLFESVSSTETDSFMASSKLVGHDRVRQRPAGYRLREPRLQGVLLTVDPVEVAVGEAVPLPDVDERVGPVEVVHPLSERDAAVAGRLPHLHVDAADRVDQRLEAREVDDREVVHAHAGEVLDRLRQQARAAERVSSIDLFWPRPGIVTQLSRGMETTAALDRSAATEASMITSLRADPGFTPQPRRCRS